MSDRKGRGPGTVATVYVQRPSGLTGIFFASSLSLSNGLLSVEGHWRGRPAAERRSYLWPSALILEVRQEPE